MIKSPKLYFFDTGLLCHLLELDSQELVKNVDRLGFLFENLILADKIKRSYHAGKTPHYYFYRDSNQV
ncbi:MAG: DUF4143 domain-containing protein, partial [Bacteroidota bacterium]